MIRLDAGMPTARFVRLLGIPERSYRRWQQRQRQGRPVRGLWPAPSRDRVEPVAIAYADRFPAWGHRKIAMLMRIDGHHGPDSTVLRALKRTGRVLPVDYQAERRQHAQARRAAFVVPPSGPNQVWQLRLQRVRDTAGRRLANRRRRRLLVEARARLARLDHRQPPRRDRDRRAGDH